MGLWAANNTPIHKKGHAMVKNLHALIHANLYPLAGMGKTLKGSGGYRIKG
jgi:hypothetical protein